MLQIDVPRPLNVNVSHAMLALTRNEALVTDILVHRGKASPYVIRNRSGDRLHVSERERLSPWRWNGRPLSLDSSRSEDRQGGTDISPHTPCLGLLPSRHPPGAQLLSG